MATRRQPAERPAPRLYFVMPRAPDPASLAGDLSRALAGVDVAAVLLPLPNSDERQLINAVKAIAPVAQDKGVALILLDRPDLVMRAGADGAHLTGTDAFLAAHESLQPECIAGCGGLFTRHDAMTAGGAGADYVMFGEPDPRGHRPSTQAVLERVGWWAEVFEVPCVAFAAELSEIDVFVAAGADFVAIGDALWRDPRGITSAIADATSRLTPREPTP